MSENKRNLLFYTNNNKCVSLPLKDDCDYLRISNYLSEYYSEYDKLKVLDNLGITNLINDLRKLIDDKFNLYTTLKFLDDNYVKKIDLYYPEEEDDDDGFEPISYTGGDGNGFGWTVDDFLSLTSINPVQNRIITAALNQKVNISALLNYIDLQLLSSYLSNYQRKLKEGFGIKIEGNVISTSLDLNPFIFVDKLPDTGDPNKIYLVPDKTNPGYYIQYNYDPNKRKWNEIGRVSISSTLTGFLTLAEADARYLKKGELPQTATQTIINQVKLLLGNYVKKSEVYTPDLWGDSSTSDDINNGGGNNSGNNNSGIDWSLIDWSQYITNITIDSELNSDSLNPVTNKAIKNAIDLKLNVLTSLNAGTGIKIENGVISCINNGGSYEFVTTFPLNPQPGKIYLIKQNGTVYKQYIYEDGKPKYIGEIDLGFDITGYLSKNEAGLLYMTKLDLANTYLTKSEFNDYILNNIGGGGSSSINLSNYATKDYVQSEIIRYLSSISTGNPIQIDDSVFATKEYVDNLLSQINTGLDSETLSKINTLLEYVNNSSNFLDVTTELAKKANLTDVYNKSESDSKYQAKGDFIYRSEFTTNLQTLNSRIDGFIIDETLSSVSTHAVLNKAIYLKLLEKLSSTTAQELYATKAELQSGLSSVNINLKTVNGQSLLGTGNIQILFPVDATINSSSTNAASSKAVYDYVNEYVNLLSNQQISLYVSNYTTLTIYPYFRQYITDYVASTLYPDIELHIDDLNLLGKLTAGDWISIDENNVISVTLDSINPFIIVDSKPTVVLPNKIYLIKENSGYRLWLYLNGDWVDKGLLDLSIDLSNYVKKSEITNLVNDSELSNYVKKSEITNLASNSDITSLTDWINDTLTQKETEHDNDIASVRSWVIDTFVKKEDVYTPDQNDTISGPIIDPTPDSGSDSGSILPPSQNENIDVGSAYYTTNLADGIRTNATVGNISANTDVSTLKGLSFSEILTRMLFKETYDNPRYTHSISIDTSQTVVKVGTTMEIPTVVTYWNPNILPQQTIASNILVKDNDNTASPFHAGDTYNNVGTYTFILNYSYPAGEYTVTSNFGNTRTYGVGANSGSLSKSVKVTYPWFINDEEQTTLIPINDNYSGEVFLTGSPKISIPGENSICTILADLGLGYMNVDWPKTTEVRNGVTYSVWTKSDPYLLNVKHKITFSIYI